MRLDIKHWQLLATLREDSSLGQAAKVLGVTQSALSHRLAEAERRLGSAIYEREGRNLRLTPAGQILVQTAMQVLPELQRAEEHFERTAEDASYLVRVGVAFYSTYSWVPGFLNRLPVKREKLQVDFVAEATLNPIKSIIDGNTDLILSPGILHNPVLESVPLFEDELVLVTHPKHPLADKKYVKAEDMVEVDYLTYSRDTVPGFEYERFLRPSGFTPKHIQVVEMTDAIVEMVSADIGVSILSKWALRRSMKQGLVKAVKVTKAGLPLQWSLLFRKSDEDNNAVMLVKDSLINWFAQ